MNRIELLLTCLAEEASEISQAASKMNRFSMHRLFPGRGNTNAQIAHLELDDLLAVVEMLNEEFGFGYEPNRDNIAAKKLKVNAMNTLHEELHKTPTNE